MAVVGGFAIDGTEEFELGDDLRGFSKLLAVDQQVVVTRGRKLVWGAIGQVARQVFAKARWVTACR